METTGRVELVSARELHSYNNNNITFIHSSTYPTLCSKEIQLPPKIKMFPPGTCP